MLSWLVLHARSLLRQFSVGKDGKTPRQRLRGRKSKQRLMEFGQSVHVMPLDALDQANANPKYMDAGWLGPRWALRSVWLGMRLELPKPHLSVENR